jgi:hypothetical protein
MNKNIIALAVAGALAAPLAAQAEVKVSGQLQVELTSLSADKELVDAGIVTEGLYLHDAQEGGNPDSGNYGAVTVSASEDLGNGMKALAKANFKVKAADTLDAGIGTRDAYIGLSGNFGTILTGTMSTPYKSSTVKWDPFLATAGQARGNFGASGLHNSYAENVLAYTNKFGPAKVVLATSFDEEDRDGDGEADGDNTNTASINVPFGPVEVALAYLDNSAVDDGDATKVGVKYAAGAFGVSFQYETLGAGAMVTAKDDLVDEFADLGVAGVAADGETFMLVNGTYTMGANTFAISYGQNTQDYVVLGADESIDNTHMTAGVVHSFSKTTSVHAAYTDVDVDGEFGASGLAVGMRVKF